jgi:hypothetical protein
LSFAFTYEQVLSELLIFYASSLHVWYAFFNQTVFKQSSHYRHPLIRSTRISIGAADNIPAEKFEPQLILKRAASVLKGIELVEGNILKDWASSQHPFDLGEEIMGMTKAYSQVDNDLEPALKAIKKHWSAPVVS